jgi:hypothetical protein
VSHLYVITRLPNLKAVRTVALANREVGSVLSAYERWTWDRCRDQILSLKGRLGYGERLWILGFELLDDGRLLDPFHGAQVFDPVQAGPPTEVPARYSAVPEMYCLLSGYAVACERPLAGEWFSLAAIDPVQRPELSPEDYAALLRYADESKENGVKFKGPFFGDKTTVGDLAFTVWPLPRVPLSLALWRGDGEMAARGSVHFDRSALAYVGDLIGELIWLTVWRLQNILQPEVKWGYHGLASATRAVGRKENDAS